MKNFKKMTENDKNEMFAMFDAGVSNREIAKRTGRSQNTVTLWKRRWKEQKDMNEEKLETKEAEVKAKSDKGLGDSDHAKAYYKGDEAVIRSNLEIKRSVQIRSNKTGIQYEMDLNDADKKMKITLTDGTEISIELATFEKFVDEGIDVYLEMQRSA